MHEVIISLLSAQPVVIDLPSVVVPVGVFGGAPPVAVAFATASAPTVTGVRHANVAAVRATSQAVSYAPVPLGTQGASVNVAAVVAGASGSVLPPVVVATRDATVNAVTATATGIAYVPGLGAALSVTSFATLSSATAIAKAPVVTGSATVVAVLATATGSAKVAVVTGESPATVFAVAAAASATANTPVIIGDAKVNAVVATATADAVDPTTPSVVSVTAKLASATSKALAPIVSGESVVTGGGPATGNAIAISPTSVTGTSANPPAFSSLGGSTTISGSLIQLAVPAGVANVPTQMVLAIIMVLGTQTVTPPTGFIEDAVSPIIVSTPAELHYLHVYWKRPTAADTGTYDFSAPGITGVYARAALFTNCFATGTPLDGAAFIDPNAATNTTPPASNTSGPNRLGLWIATCFAGGGFTFTGGYTEQFDNGNLGFATLPVNAGPIPPSGTLQATTGSSTQSAVWFGTIISPSGP